MKRRAFWQGLFALGLTGLAGADDAVPEPNASDAPNGAPATAAETTAPEEGPASWYGGHRWHGRRTASGEPFDRHAFTAAHRSLPLGSWVRVVNLANGREVHVRINDRGPRNRRFVIDLSEAAAEHLGFRRKGMATVRLHRSAAPRQRKEAASSF